MSNKNTPSRSRSSRSRRPSPSGHTEGLRHRLREAREQAGMTQEDVARALLEFDVEVGATTISMWENLHRNPDLAEMSAWARVVGLRLVVELEEANSTRRPVMIDDGRAEIAKLAGLVSFPKVPPVERILERILDMSTGEVMKLSRYLAKEEEEPTSD